MCFIGIAECKTRYRQTIKEKAMLNKGLTEDEERAMDNKELSTSGEEKKELPIEARHTICLEISKKRRQSVAGSIFMPKELKTGKEISKMYHSPVQPTQSNPKINIKKNLFANFLKKASPAKIAKDRIIKHIKTRRLLQNRFKQLQSSQQKANLLRVKQNIIKQNPTVQKPERVHLIHPESYVVQHKLSQTSGRESVQSVIEKLRKDNARRNSLSSNGAVQTQLIKQEIELGMDRNPTISFTVDALTQDEELPEDIFEPYKAEMSENSYETSFVCKQEVPQNFYDTPQSKEFDGKSCCVPGVSEQLRSIEADGNSRNNDNGRKNSDSKSNYSGHMNISNNNYGNDYSHFIKEEPIDVEQLQPIYEPKIEIPSEENPFDWSCYTWSTPEITKRLVYTGDTSQQQKIISCNGLDLSKNQKPETVVSSFIKSENSVPEEPLSLYSELDNIFSGNTILPQQHLQHDLHQQSNDFVGNYLDLPNYNAACCTNYQQSVTTTPKQYPDFQKEMNVGFATHTSDKTRRPVATPYERNRLFCSSSETKPKYRPFKSPIKNTGKQYSHYPVNDQNIVTINTNTLFATEPAATYTATTTTFTKLPDFEQPADLTYYKQQQRTQQFYDSVPRQHETRYHQYQPSQHQQKLQVDPPQQQRRQEVDHREQQQQTNFYQHYPQYQQIDHQQLVAPLQQVQYQQFQPEVNLYQNIQQVAHHQEEDQFTFYQAYQIFLLHRQQVFIQQEQINLFSPEQLRNLRLQQKQQQLYYDQIQQLISHQQQPNIQHFYNQALASQEKWFQNPYQQLDPYHQQQSILNQSIPYKQYQPIPKDTSYQQLQQQQQPASHHQQQQPIFYHQQQTLIGSGYQQQKQNLLNFYCQQQQIDYLHRNQEQQNMHHQQQQQQQQNLHQRQQREAHRQQSDLFQQIPLHLQQQQFP